MLSDWLFHWKWERIVPIFLFEQEISKVVHLAKMVFHVSLRYDACEPQTRYMWLRR